VFEWFTINYATAWLSEHWKSSITNVVDQDLNLEIMPEANSPTDGKINVQENIDTLKKLCSFLIEKALGAINTCPRPLWEFFSILADYTSQDVFQFLFINFFALALEDPLAYHLVSKKPGKPALRTLGILSEMVSNIGNNNDFLIAAHNVLMDSEERARFVSDS